MPRSPSFIADLQQRWTRMPRSNRVWLSCLMGLMFAITVCSLNYQTQPKVETLLGGQSFTGRELVALEGAFAKAGLADYEVIGDRVQIPRERRSSYVAALMDAQIVPAAQPVPTLSAASPFESSGQRAAREEAMLERELSECVRRFQEIDDASVRIDEAVIGQGFQRTKRMTAMVVVQSATGPLAAERIRSICRLVASSRVELEENNVTVTDLTSGRCYGGHGSAGLAKVDFEQTDDFVLRKQDSERQWKQKIQQALQFIPGAQVATSVELQPSPGARDGLVARSVAVSVNVPNSYYETVWEKHRQLASQQLDPNAEETTLEAIEHETRERILQTIRPLLPSSLASQAAGDSPITVTSFPDVASVADVRNPIAVGGGVTSIVSWFRANFAGWFLALLGATLLGFYALRGLGSDLQRLWSARQVTDQSSLRVVREHAMDREHSAGREHLADRESEVVAESYSEAPEVIAYESGRVDVSDQPNQKTQTSQRERELMESSTQSTDDVFADGESPVHDELTQIVRENPDAAAELLKEWIEKAG